MGAAAMMGSHGVSHGEGTTCAMCVIVQLPVPWCVRVVGERALTPSASISGTRRSPLHRFLRDSAQPP